MFGACQRDGLEPDRYDVHWYLTIIRATNSDMIATAP